MLSRAYHFILTVNNAKITIEEFKKTAVEKGAISGCAQLEVASTGTPHIQATISFADAKSIKSVIKKFPGAHVEICRDPRKSWDYCCKAESRVEPGLTWGEPPKPRKNVKGETAEYNKRILKMGAKAAVDEGLVRIQDLPKLVAGLNQY